MSEEILFISDLHINRSDKMLLDDTKDRLKEIVGILYRDNVQYLVILGDIHEKNDPRYDIEDKIFYEFLGQAITMVKKILIVGGNHGVTNLATSVVDRLRKILKEIYKPHEDGCEIYFADYVFSPVMFVDMGGCMIGAVSHLPNIYLKENGYDSYVQGIDELLSGKEMDIFCSHFPIKNAMIGSYQLVGAEVDPEELRAVVKADQIILGDIHAAQTIGGMPPIMYPGSIERMTFGECNETKQVLVYNIEERSINIINLNARPRFTGDYTAGDLQKLLNDISHLDKSRLRLKIKLNLKSGENVERVVEEFGKALSGIFEVSIDPFVESERKVKTPELMEAHTDMEIFQTFVKANVSENKLSVLDIGEKIINDNKS